jgi:hypothetical protein
MTEAEWLACLEPYKMLFFLREKVSERKLRLFALACCRRIWQSITDPRCRAAVEFAERFVEVGLARRKGRPGVAKAAEKACREASLAASQARELTAHAACMIQVHACHAAFAAVGESAWFAAALASDSSANALSSERFRGDPTEPLVWTPDAKEAALAEQVPYLQDIFADPFHTPSPVSTTVLAWRAGAARKLAGRIYKEGTFERLPDLAHALEDAGCVDAELLGHLHGNGPHVRGCWALDLILGLT